MDNASTPLARPAVEDSEFRLAAGSDESRQGAILPTCM